MENKFKDYIKLVPGYIWTLAFIALVGIFLRVFHFSDWLLFSPDQARDAFLIKDVIVNKAPMPLLGAQAGNTRFSLGPLYYYAQYASSMIFGVSPQSMAFPDLFFGILTIPFLFIFLRKFFSIQISLAMSGIMSISYFFIFYSRHALNTNSIPFFVLLFLYSLLEIMDKKNDQKWIWGILLGTAIGVGIQLHTLLIAGMPIVAVLVLIWISAKRRIFVWRALVGCMLVLLILNYGQILHEYKTDYSNTRALLFGVSDHSGDGSKKLLTDTGLILSCQLQANFHFISSIENIESCGGLFKISKQISNDSLLNYKLTRDFVFIIEILIVAIFSLGGYFLMFRYFLQQQDEKRRNFLLLVGTYNLVLLAIFVPVAGEIAMHYFITLWIVPFVLLGLWLKLLLDKFSKKGLYLFIVIICLLVFSNIFIVSEMGGLYFDKKVSNSDTSILGEINPMADYILENSSNQGVSYFNGKFFYRKRFYRPLSYIIENSQSRLIILDGMDSNLLPEKGRLFYITNASQKIIDGRIDNFTIKGGKKFNDVIIYILEK